MSTQVSYVIIGNGITGITAAETLRANDPSSSITIIADDPFPAYYRPALKDYLGGKLPEEKLWARPNTFYQEQRIRFIQGRVIGINTNQNVVHLHNGQHIGYHKLLLANGARPNQLRCPGMDLAGVSTLRTIADYQEIMRLLESSKRIVIVGSGTLALESAETLSHRGYKVIHLLRQHTLWSEVLDHVASDLVLSEEQRAGIDMRTGEEIVEIIGRKGRVSGAITTSGTQISCDMILIAIGIEPLIDFIQTSGITCGRGVKVNQYMQTSVPDVYAAGDVIETTDAITGRSRLLGQWYPAIEQARKAALSMIGKFDARTGTYLDSNYYNATFLYGLDFVSVGTTHFPQNSEGLQEIVADPQPRNYRKVIVRNGILIGFLFLGDRKHALAFKRAIDHKVNLTPILSRIFAQDFNLDKWLDQRGVPPVTVEIVNTSHYVNKQSWQLQSDANPSHLPSAHDLSSSMAKGAFIQAYLVPIPHPKLNVAIHKTALNLDEHNKVFTIGRQKEVSFVIEHSSVSRLHCEIMLLNGKYFLRDKQSTNGTYVNNVRLDQDSIYTLRNLDQIRIGDVQCRFELRQQAITTTISSQTVKNVSTSPNPTAQLGTNLSSILPISFLNSLQKSPSLVIVHKNANPRIIPIEQERRLTIGRGKENDIVLDDTAVSRKHAEIFNALDGFYIRDLESSYGVFVNTMKINNPFYLSHGNHIVIGNTLIYFSYPASLETRHNTFTGIHPPTPSTMEEETWSSTPPNISVFDRIDQRSFDSKSQSKLTWEYSTSNYNIHSSLEDQEPPSHPIYGMIHRSDVEKLSDQRVRFEIDMCIGCDRCMSACPIPMSTLVNIADLNIATISQKVSTPVARFTHECIMCGSCVPVCPVDNHRDLLMLSLKQKLGVSWDNQVDTQLVAQNIPSGWTLPHLINCLRKQRFLNNVHNVPENYLLHIIASSKLRHLSQGDTSIREGDYGRDVFLILQGRLALFSEEMDDITYPLAILGQGEHIGEDGMLTGLPYKVTARAQLPALVLQVPEQAMQRLMELVPDVQRYFDQVNNARSLKSILKRMALFEGVSDADLHSLIQHTTIKQYDRSELLFAESNERERPSRETLHIILEGFVKVTRHALPGLGHHSSGEIVIAYRQGGDYFAGGLDLLGDGRAVGVEAINRVRVAEVPRQTMLTLFQHYPEVNHRFAIRLSEYVDTSISTQGYALINSPLTNASSAQVLPDGAIRDGLHSLVSDGVIEGTEVLVIDLDKCIHCSECEDACARRHGQSRVNRKGMVIGNISIATACRQCQDPVCMLCSRAGIARHPDGEVYITESCIGCGICAERCPYGAISIVNIEQNEHITRSSWQRFSSFFTNYIGKGGSIESPFVNPGPLDTFQPDNRFEEMRKKVAIKCDLCAGYKDQACVEACPVGAAVRIQPTRFFGSTEEILRRRV